MTAWSRFLSCYRYLWYRSFYKIIAHPRYVYYNDDIYEPITLIIQCERCIELMSRIPPIEDIPFPQDESLPFASMSLLFRTMGHRPELMQQSMQLLQTAMRRGTVDPRLKELLAVRVSQVNHCFY
jgi:Carboxymuconolactone decarboxylase family